MMARSLGSSPSPPDKGRPDASETRYDRARRHIGNILPEFRLFRERSQESERAYDFYRRIYRSRARLEQLGVFADLIKEADSALYQALAAYQYRRERSLSDLLPPNPNPTRGGGRPPRIETLSDAELIEKARADAARARERARKSYLKRKAAEA